MLFLPSLWYPSSVTLPTCWWYAHFNFWFSSCYPVLCKIEWFQHVLYFSSAQYRVCWNKKHYWRTFVNTGCTFLRHNTESVDIRSTEDQFQHGLYFSAAQFRVCWDKKHWWTISTRLYLTTNFLNTGCSFLRHNLESIEIRSTDDQFQHGCTWPPFCGTWAVLFCGTIHIVLR